VEQEEAEEEEEQEEDEAEDDKEKEQEKEQMQEKQAWAPKTSAENTYLLRFCIRHRADAQHNRQQAENALRQENDHAGPVIKIACVVFGACAPRNRDSSQKHRTVPFMAKVQRCERVTPKPTEKRRVGLP